MQEEIVAGEFKKMKRSELQKRAKKIGIKANMKTEQLIKALEEHYANLAEEKCKAEQTESLMKEQKNSIDTSVDHAQSGKKDEKKEMKTKATKRGRGKRRKQSIVKSDSEEGKITKPSEEAEQQVPKQEEMTAPAPDNRKPERRGKRSKSKERSAQEEKPATSLEEEPIKPSKKRSSGRRGKTSDVLKSEVPTKSEKEQEMKSAAQKRLLSSAEETEMGPDNKRRKVSVPTKSTPTINRSFSSKTPVSKKKTPQARMSIFSSQNKPTPKPERKLRRSTFEAEPSENETQPNVGQSRAEPKPTEKALTVPPKKTCIPLPKFHSTKITPGQSFDFSKMHKAQFQKMESIDDYLERKRKRIEALTGSSFKKVKISSPAVTKTQPRKSTGTPGKANKPRSNLFSPRPVKPDAASVKGVSFHSHTKLKGPFKMVTCTMNSTAGNTPGVRKSIAVSQVNRKSIGAENVAPVPRKSLSGTSVTPFKFTAQPVTPGSKRKAFDLKASLERKLNYKPYTGKIKPLTEEVTNIKPISHIEKAKSELKKPKVPNRQERQKITMRHRAKKRGDAVMARRGLSMA